MPWEMLLAETGFGSGMSCRQRLCAARAGCSPSSNSASAAASFARPCAIAWPRSSSRLRIWFISDIRSPTKRSRTRCNVKASRPACRKLRKHQALQPLARRGCWSNVCNLQPSAPKGTCSFPPNPAGDQSVVIAPVSAVQGCFRQSCEQTFTPDHDARQERLVVAAAGLRSSRLGNVSAPERSGSAAAAAVGDRAGWRPRRRRETGRAVATPARPARRSRRGRPAGRRT